MPRSTPRLELALLATAVTGLAAGVVASVLTSGAAANVLWWTGTLPVLAALLVEIARSLRRGDFGLDLIAALSMSSALAVGEPLAANVVALMYAGGNMLEAYAEGRARAEMTALLERAPRTAMRRTAAGLETVPIGSVEKGDVLLVRQGELVPVDGEVAADHSATLDTSSLTGEAIPRVVAPQGEVMSGSVCLERPFEMIAIRPASESAYASIVRLVENAQATKAPMGRLADRYAIAFFVATVILAALAWMLTGLPQRAVAVLVVATPCPLILAVPVALISGLSRAARSGLLLKSGAVLEKLAAIRTLVIDKTGTLTHGRARVDHVVSSNGFSEDEILRVAASLDQASTHVLAAALIEAANGRGLDLSLPAATTEEPGAGIAGLIEGRRVAIGGRGFLRRHMVAAAVGSFPPERPHSIGISVAIDGVFAGEIVLEDPLRANAGDTIAILRRLGVSRIILASGDQREITRRVGTSLPLDEVAAELSPAEKAELVVRNRLAGPLMMVGDGVNDAPALAAADVGIAMGASGSAASTEAADAVVLVDDLRPIARGIEIAQRTRRIALQSVLAGLGLSLAAMVVAAFGYLPPVQGALVQEAIDVAVIFNALRALR